MKIFYNENGEVVGTIEALQNIEEAASMESAVKVDVPQDIAMRINDPLDNMTIDSLALVDGELIVN